MDANSRSNTLVMSDMNFEDKGLPDGWTLCVHPQRALLDANDALTWYYTDDLISGSRSLAPFSKDECENSSRVLADLTSSCNTNSIAKTVFAAWLPREVCSFWASIYYGQYTQNGFKRLRESRTLPPNVNSRPPLRLALPVLDLIINLCFFGIPHTYYAHVKRISRAISIRKAELENHVERLVQEYSHFLLLSTVLLSATVGLLAVPELAEPARVASILSAFTSLGSIFVGVLSIWRHQTHTRTADSFKYMHNAQHSYLRFHEHAMLLSLPPVLLIWAIVAFTILIIAYTLQGLKEADAMHRASAWTVLAVFLILLIVVIAALYVHALHHLEISAEILAVEIPIDSTASYSLFDPEACT
ncbi:hypothetical protein Hypma_010338 [Hypsizygus marmoreus]|uniref:Uncharacterized protein n=1 Tax=Hypsizygus marmoreus TaxID=39966 RepID=A0A369JVX8_HYPMA|nr:hypothetical protein Hypma_010338 [Hypsizygus marmoreus]